MDERKDLKKESFWDRVIKCKHENLYPDYLVTFKCSTPYCYGEEVHCKDCGAYISSCGCGANNDISGWSDARWNKFNKKKEKKFS